MKTSVEVPDLAYRSLRILLLSENRSFTEWVRDSIKAELEARGVPVPQEEFEEVINE